MIISIEKIRSLSQSIFEKVGLSADDASVMTDVLIQTEMKGVFTHGFLRLERYVDCIKAGGIRTDGRIDLVYDSPSWACVDGCDNLGIVVAYKAMLFAMEKAKATGVGVVNVRGSHHFGAAGYYTGMCADAGMVGLSMSNGDVLIAATGSRERTIGNNPFSYAFPAGKYNKIVYDIAMSYTSDRKIAQMATEGIPLPNGWILDRNGSPTTDAREYEKGGVLMPFGGYKGYGLAMMVETLAATLSGAAMTQKVHAWNTDPTNGGNVGHFFLALDISKLGDVDAYRKRVDAMIDEIKASQRADGVAEIYYPGEIEQRKLENCLRENKLKIADETMDSVYHVAKKLNLHIPDVESEVKEC